MAYPTHTKATNMGFSKKLGKVSLISQTGERKDVKAQYDSSEEVIAVVVSKMPDWDVFEVVGSINGEVVVSGIVLEEETKTVSHMKRTCLKVNNEAS